MKCLVVALIACAALVAADDEWKPLEKPEIKKAHDDCKNEIEDNLERKTADIDFCVVKKMGIFDEEKGYDLERTLAQVKVVLGEIDGAREIIAGCIGKNENIESAAEWADHGQQCIARSKIGNIARKKNSAQTEEAS